MAAGGVIRIDRGTLGRQHRGGGPRTVKLHSFIQEEHNKRVDSDFPQFQQHVS